METSENNPIPEQKNENTENPNPIPETKDQGKSKSDRQHIDPLQKKAYDNPNSGGRTGK